MKNSSNPKKIKFLSFFLRLIPITGIVILFFYLIAPAFINGHLKLFKNELRILHPEYEIIDDEIIKFNQLKYIQFYIKVHKTPTLPDSPARNGAIVKLKGQASTLCIAPIIIFSLILAWPGLALKKRSKAVLLAIPFTIVIAMLDYPLIFISEIESAFSDAPVMNNVRLVWKHLLNNGGRQFLAIVVFLTVMLIVNRESQKKILTEKAGRNDPCPCGSGKKYKQCCINK